MGVVVGIKQKGSEWRGQGLGAVSGCPCLCPPNQKQIWVSGFLLRGYAVAPLRRGLLFVCLFVCLFCLVPPRPPLFLSCVSSSLSSPPNSLVAPPQHPPQTESINRSLDRSTHPINHSHSHNPIDHFNPIPPHPRPPPRPLSPPL